MTEDRTEQVWDPLVRLFHWGAAAGFVTAYLTAEESMDLHQAAGLAVAGLLALRVLWGLIGPEPARLASFVPTPARLGRYIDSLSRGEPARYATHNPLGAVMVIALMIGLGTTVTTGLMMDEHEEGDEEAELSAASGSGMAVISAARASEDEAYEGAHEAHDDDEGADEPEAEGGEALEGLHGSAATATGLLALLHVLGVLWGSIHERQNLVAGMVDGYKRPPSDGAS